jgi:cobyrinic acid a,c-diamide synthase
LAQYRPGLHLTGVLANNVGSAHHADLLKTSLQEGIAWYGALAREALASLPERHLGIMQAAEIADLDARLDRLAAALPAAADTLPPAVTFTAAPAPAIRRALNGVRVAVALDAAFGFIYPANLDTLAALGADVAFFSPLAGESVPDADALWLPGGYPELHAAQLAQNRAFFDALHAHRAAGRPILAECGGMLVLFDTLTDAAGAMQRMAGLLPGGAVMQPRLAALGAQALPLPEGALRGHTFHYSRLETPVAPALHATTPDGRPGEAMYRAGRLTASYVHAYFPSNPAAVAALFTP